MNNILTLNSSINFNYHTIKMTQSRLNYGLLAIPTSLINLFPDKTCDINVYFDNLTILQTKKFIISEKNREARIYGLSEWYRNNNLQVDDEIVIQSIDKQNLIYKLIPETLYINRNQSIEEEFDKTEDEGNAIININQLADLNQIEIEKASSNELFRLSNIDYIERKQVIKNQVTAKEIVPANLRILFNNIYKGHCQVCDFWFLKQDNRPYFELHHIDPKIGNHPKNILMVCANCHKQFTFANVEEKFDNGWLTKVYFNKKEFLVNQAVLSKNVSKFYKYVHF